MSGQAIIRTGDLPPAPLDAAARFYAACLPPIRRDLAASGERPDLVIVFAPAGHEHRAWRLAAIQELAREMAPRRINGVVGSDAQAIDEAAAFLASAPGVTGQLLEVAGASDGWQSGPMALD